MNNTKINLLDKTHSEIEEIINKLDEPSFRARQILKWIYDKKINSFYDMSNLPESLIFHLNNNFIFSPLKILYEQSSRDGTRKFLMELQDSNLIETVLIPHKDKRLTLCLSTQVGCAMGCSFCATGTIPFRRNLSCGEMVNQVLTVEKHLDERINNIVFMGMGEPLLNYKNLLKALKLINHKEGFNIAMRKITVSTCGIVPQIYSLAKEKLQLTLAVSLNSASNRLRDTLMPVNKKYPIEELIKASNHYSEKTGRRISYEYVLIGGVNDTRQQALALTNLLRGKLAHVNFIPINPIGKEYMKPAPSKNIRLFTSIMDKAAIPYSIRKERGRDIKAACGLLRGEQK